VSSAKDPEIAQQERIRPAIGAWEIFRERVPETHVNAALDLSRTQQRIDSASDVVRRDNLFERAVLGEDDHLGCKAECHMCDGFLNVLMWCGGEIADELTVETASDEIIE